MSKNSLSHTLFCLNVRTLPSLRRVQQMAGQFRAKLAENLLAPST
jgi:hypothetical protein